MKWTAEEIQTAIACTGLTLVGDAVHKCSGLTVEEAQGRLDLCLKQGTLTPTAEMWQVRAWMIRQGIDLATVPDIIEGAVPVGPQRTEALMRWDKAAYVPADSPLVAIVAQSLGLNVASIWWDVLAI